MWIGNYYTMRQTRRDNLDDAFAVTVFELLSATAGAGFVASGQLVLDNGLLGYLFAVVVVDMYIAKSMHKIA